MSVTLASLETDETQDEKNAVSTAVEPILFPDSSTSSTSITSAKTSGKASGFQNTLNVPVPRRGRSASPDTLSLLSVDDFTELQLVQSNVSSTTAEQRILYSKSLPEWRRKLYASWIRNKGIAFVLVAQFTGSLMILATRLMETEGNGGEGMQPFQILFVRMTITVSLCSLFMWYMRTPDFPLGKPEVRLLLALRGIGGFFGVFGLYGSLQYLPLSDATVLTFIAPSIACWICSKVLHEPFTRTEQICGFISLGGVVLIARPDFIFYSSHSTPSPGGAPTDSITSRQAELSPHPDRKTPIVITGGQRLYAVSMSMLGVCGAVVAFVTIRWIGHRAHPLISVNYFAAWATLVSTFFVFILPLITSTDSASPSAPIQSVLPTTLKDWSLLVFVGVTGFVTQFLMTAGLRYEKSSRATGMVYSSMLFAILFDKLVFGVSPTVWSWCGSGLIMGGAVAVALQKARTPVVKEGERHRVGRRTGELDQEEMGLVAGMDGAGDEVLEMEVQPRGRAASTEEVLQEMPAQVLGERPHP